MRRISFIALGRGMALGFTLCLLTLGFVPDAAAAGPGPGAVQIQTTGGYTGPGPALVSAKQAMSMPHDAALSLKGNITKYLGKDEYTFADSTGAVEVKIPPHAWMGQYVSESDVVELQGEVRQDRGGTRIHVHRVIKR